MTSDRISEVYRGEVFSEAAQEEARRRVHWIVDRVEGDEVLDVGCSQGIVSLLLARKGKKVFGIDTDLTALSFAGLEADGEPREVRERLRFSCVDAFQLAFKNGFGFDTVVLGQILEHVGDAEALLSVAFNMCKRDGKMILTTPFGVIDHPDHAQVFFPFSLLKMTGPRFQVEELDVIGKRICCVFRKRPDGEPISEYWLERICEISERAFHKIEAKYLGTIAHQREVIKAQRETYQRLKTKYGHQTEQLNTFRRKSLEDSEV